MANEKRLIDANDAISKLEDELHMCKPVSMDDGYLEKYKKGVIPKLLRNVIDWLENQPTVDAVEVVRCKDCENRVYVDNGDEIGEIGGCKLFKMAMPYDSFCSYGKRRSTENV